MSGSGAADAWAAPGVPFSRSAAADTAPDLTALVAAVEGALAADPALLAPGAAVVRAEGLLAAQERLAAAALRAVADVDARELWRERAAGSTRTWLRTLPCGEGGQLTAVRLLADRPLLARALEDGRLSLRTVVSVGRELARVPAHVDPEQVEAVLVDGLGDLLGVWAGAACLEPTAAQEAEFDRRREELAAAVRAGLENCWSDVAGQLEPAFVLAAQVLAPAEVVAGLGLLVDALQPEVDADALGEQEFRSRGLELRKLKRGGWSLRAHLTDETGQLLYDELSVRVRKHPGQERAEQDAQARAAAARGCELVEDVVGHHDVDACGPRPADVEPVLDVAEAHEDDTAAAVALAQDVPADETCGRDDGQSAVGDEAAEDEAYGDEATEDDGAPDDGGVDDSEADVHLFGVAGPGEPVDPTDTAVQGTPIGSRDQLWHDALHRLLADLGGGRPGSQVPAPARLTIVAPLSALEGRAGAPPGVLRTAKGDVPLTGSRLRRYGCGGLLYAVLRDAQRRPVGASGQHRDATARERRALHAAWGRLCGVAGCGLPGDVPHHAEPFWKSGETVLKDLVPICEHHHHDVHDGHKTLRLRDGRLLDEWGWVTAARTDTERWAV